MSSSQSHRYFPISTRIPELVEDSQTPSNEVDLSRLPGDLLRAVQEKWEIAPVSVHSKFASLVRACFAEPSNDPAVVTKAYDWFPKSNWAARTGRGSNLVILEVDHEKGQDALSDLCEDRWDLWSDTLRFSHDRATFFLFHYPLQRQLRPLSRSFPGLRIHAGGLVLVPPSWFAAASPLRFINADPVQDCPAFLTDETSDRENVARVIPFPVQ